MRPYDVTYTVVNAGLWVVVECNIGIVSACLPVMKPLFNVVPLLPKSITRLLPSSLRSRYFSGKGSKQSSSGYIKDSRNGRLSMTAPRKQSTPLGPNAADMGYQYKWPHPSMSSNVTGLRQIETRTSTDGRSSSIYPDTPTSLPGGFHDLEQGREARS